MADRTRGIACGGVALILRLVLWCGPRSRIDRALSLLKVHLPGTRRGRPPTSRPIAGRGPRAGRPDAERRRPIVGTCADREGGSRSWGGTPGRPIRREVRSRDPGRRATRATRDPLPARAPRASPSSSDSRRGRIRVPGLPRVARSLRRGSRTPTTRPPRAIPAAPPRGQRARAARDRAAGGSSCASSSQLATLAISVPRGRCFQRSMDVLRGSSEAAVSRRAGIEGFFDASVTVCASRAGIGRAERRDHQPLRRARRDAPPVRLDEVEVGPRERRGRRDHPAVARSSRQASSASTTRPCTSVSR